MRIDLALSPACRLIAVADRTDFPGITLHIGPLMLCLGVHIFDGIAPYLTLYDERRGFVYPPSLVAAMGRFTAACHAAAAEFPAAWDDDDDGPAVVLPTPPPAPAPTADDGWHTIDRDPWPPLVDSPGPDLQSHAPPAKSAADILADFAATKAAVESRPKTKTAGKSRPRRKPRVRPAAV